MESKYTFQKKLESRRSELYKALRNSDQKPVVIKKLSYANLSSKQKQQIVDEVNALNQVKSSNIVRYIDRFQNKSESELYIVMEYCGGGSLAQQITNMKISKQRLSEEVIWKTFAQIVTALSCIHNSETVILHRNIKPSNVFIDEGDTVKLGDFGLARKLDPQEQFSSTIIDQTYYLSPEQMQSGKFTKKTDIWALGCLLFQMCCLQAPFQGGNKLQTERLVRQSRPKKVGYSSEMNRVINWCLDKKPENRPGVDQLKGVPEINLKMRQKRYREQLKSFKKKEADLEKRQRELQGKIRQCKFLLAEQQSQSIPKQVASNIRDSKDSYKDKYKQSSKHQQQVYSKYSDAMVIGQYPFKTSENINNGNRPYQSRSKQAYNSIKKQQLEPIIHTFRPLQPELYLARNTSEY